MTDLEILHEIANVIGCEDFALLEGENDELISKTGYILDKNKKVSSLYLNGLEFSNLENIVKLLVGLSNLTVLSFDDNQVSDLSPLINLTNLTVLSFDGIQVSDLSPLANLTNLTVLSFGGNQISDLSPLSNLANLTVLSFGGNQISDLSPLSNLTKLTALYFSNNQVSDLSPLSNLTNLTKLYFSNNQVSDLSPLANLAKLTELYFDYNQASDLSPLANLTKLTELSFGNNRVSDLSPLANLLSLNYLYFEGNKVTDISCLGKLKMLKGVDASYNLIQNLPSFIIDMGLAIKWELVYVSNKIIIGGNPFKNPPLEIVKQGDAAIRAWFKDDKVFVNEVKVLLVGHGEVGKTTLVKRLTGLKPDPDEKSTHHIRISSQEIKYKSKSIKLNFWDFGGQEVMHSTHQFFLSKRSIYLLVLDGRRDEDAEYWLKHIESFGGNSPVLVVLNKMAANPGYDLDRNFLKNKYPFIYGFYKTECLGRGTGISDLKKALAKVLSEVEILTSSWPKTWVPVKIVLEEMQEDFISQNEYENICTEQGIDEEQDKEVLAEFLNDLGIVVHFKDMRLKDLHILQPRWASRAAYKIINSPKVAGSKGLLKTEWMSSIMKKEGKDDFVYQTNTFPYILDLMQKFELCYAINNGNAYLIPELMDIQQPILPKQEGPVLRFLLKYDVLLPRSIITRFIVRMHQDIEDDLRWRTGVVLAVPDVFGTKAIVIADFKERKIGISVSGNRRREHFAMIRKTFHDLNRDFEKLPMTELVPLPIEEEHYVEYAELLGYEESGKDEYFVGKLKKTFRVKDLLDGIEPENVRKEQYRWDVFVCHSSKDKDLLKPVLADFRKLGIKYWMDSEQIDPGDNVIDKITDGLQNSKSILPCISQNQLKSGWSREEYQSILSRVISGISTQRVIPFVLDDTTDKDIPLFLGNRRAERFKIAEQYERLLEFLSGPYRQKFY